MYANLALIINDAFFDAIHNEYVIQDLKTKDAIINGFHHDVKDYMTEKDIDYIKYAIVDFGTNYTAMFEVKRKITESFSVEAI